jgi:DNA-binding MarR family transcriptional regulator
MLLNAIALGGEGGAAMKPLADFLVMDRTTLSRNLRPLQRAGLVKVARSPDDARVRLLLLTHAGRRVVREALPLWVQAHGRVVEALGSREAAELRRRLDAALAATSSGPVTPSGSSGPDKS